MQVDAYRLWQHWQQMHYPRRGLPADEAARARLVTLDGTAGGLLEPYFCRGRQSKTLDRAALAALARCRRELAGEDLASDASRYFERLRLLIDLVTADVPGVDAEPVGSESVQVGASE
jgi:hypothetical protein